VLVSGANNPRVRFWSWKAPSVVAICHAAAARLAERVVLRLTLEILLPGEIEIHLIERLLHVLNMHSGLASAAWSACHAVSVTGRLGWPKNPDQGRGF
jgi:hypothetical protein